MYDKEINYCLDFNNTYYNNPLFKEILINEIKRISKKNYTPIDKYYNDIDLEELQLQIICVDATLSRGSLALAEKYMIKNNVEKEEIQKRINKFSKNYIFYLYAKNIYHKFINIIEKENINGLEIFSKLKYLGENGYFNNLVEDCKNI